MWKRLYKILSTKRLLKLTIARYSAIFSIGLIFSGCVGSRINDRVTECNKLTAFSVRNRIAYHTMLYGQFDPDKMIDTFSQLGAELKEISFQDATLKEYQSQLVASYEASAISLKNASKLIEINKTLPDTEKPKNVEEIEKALEPFTKAAFIDELIIDKINDYCRLQG